MGTNKKRTVKSLKTKYMYKQNSEGLNKIQLFTVEKQIYVYMTKLRVRNVLNREIIIYLPNKKKTR